jgi:methylated-DNA-[protein]-cysteine S-methyltransferase
MTYFMDYASPLGTVLLTSDGERLTGLYFAGEKGQPRIEPSWRQAPELPMLDQARRELDEYFRAVRRTFDVALTTAGTAFERRVWEAISRIPYGATTSYQALAASIGQPRAARAVGSATGRNPIGIIVPCHRVLGAGGQLTGYAGGLQRKRALLELESDARSPGRSAAHTQASRSAAVRG